ncbi:conserved hypothetical protein [Microsporum canis CBS 113480]|uniref:Uncharacterized protein n=1 Tax=Arthroderma otae (strain ATCC MYA-4605 / CBS 113480) TaxID=554155 RepID=C5FP31_ARTOC|nr:conserved hypothetical protein [Microsporum canis CBS 113480]EEQ31884.1 conserved hypothetical protein [Microsporum canis CBS 113480]
MHESSISTILTISLGAKIVLFFLEAQAKHGYLKEPYNSYSPESSCGILNWSFLLWLNDLFITSFKKIMTYEVLSRIDERIDSRVLEEKIGRAWDAHTAICLLLEWLLTIPPRLALVGLNYAQPLMTSRALNLLSNKTPKNPGTMIQDGLQFEGAALILMSTDIESIVDSLEPMNEIWRSTIEIAIGIWLLERQLGENCVVPIIIILHNYGVKRSKNDAKSFLFELPLSDGFMWLIIDPTLLGAALNTTLVLNQSLQKFIRSWTSLETSLGAIARVKSCIASTPTEGHPGEDRKPPAVRPSRGEIKFESVSASYDGVCRALSNITMRLQPGEKIGICGRAGSGKSSIILSLLWLLDISTSSIVKNTAKEDKEITRTTTLICFGPLSRQLQASALLYITIPGEIVKELLLKVVGTVSWKWNLGSRDLVAVISERVILSPEYGCT